MKKKLSRASGKAKARTAQRQPREKKSFLILLKSWMFVVMFALMLGVGAIIGTYINQQANLDNPEVAGASVEVIEAR